MKQGIRFANVPKEVMYKVNNRTTHYSTSSSVTAKIYKKFTSQNTRVRTSLYVTVNLVTLISSHGQPSRTDKTGPIRHAYH